MQIAHISDLHIIATTDPPGILRADTVARARALMADLSAFPGLDLVVITGDNVNDERPEEYAMLADVLAGLSVPFLILPGNHDDRAHLRATVPDRPYPDPKRLFHLWQGGDARVIVLDTLAQGEIGGRLLTPQLDWLETILAAPFDGHTLIALHHPPSPPAMGKLDRNVLIEGNGRLQALLDGLPRPATLLCGHMHRPFTTHFGRSFVSAATSTAFQFTLDIGAPGEPRTVVEPYHYSVHVLGGHGQHAIHRRFTTL
jgi:3',5'-cyclic-AMP phosphodiesterase